MDNNYENKARELWEDTAASREYTEKTKGYTKEKWAESNDGLMAIFAEFAACKDGGASADSAEAQALVAKLQAHITANYYTCTDEILAGVVVGGDVCLKLGNKRLCLGRIGTHAAILARGKLRKDRH